MNVNFFKNTLFLHIAISNALGGIGWIEIFFFIFIMLVILWLQKKKVEYNELLI